MTLFGFSRSDNYDQFYVQHVLNSVWCKSNPSILANMDQPSAVFEFSVARMEMRK